MVKRVNLFISIDRNFWNCFGIFWAFSSKKLKFLRPVNKTPMPFNPWKGQREKTIFLEVFEWHKHTLWKIIYYTLKFFVVFSSILPCRVVYRSNIKLLKSLQAKCSHKSWPRQIWLWLDMFVHCPKLYFHWREFLI